MNFRDRNYCASCWHHQQRKLVEEMRLLLAWRWFIGLAQPRCRMSTARLTTSTCLGEPVLPRILGGSHDTEQS